MSDKTTKQEVLNFLHEHPMAVLSTISKNNRPWGAAIYYFADSNFNFYFLTKSETSKSKNINSTLYAALTVADPSSETTVQTAGIVIPVIAKKTVDYALKNLAAQQSHGDYSRTPPIIKLHKGEWKVFKLIPTYLQYADYKAKKTDDGSLIKVLIPDSHV